MKRLFITSISIVAIVLSVVLYTHAQLGTADLSISTIPINPQPLQNVEIRLQSFGFDLSQASITWQNNGITIASGIGRTSITLTAPPSGKVSVITVTATSTDFASTTATLLLRPGSVDILFEGADSYTPPFYKGLALPSHNGLIRAVAIPAISAPRGLTYTWSENDSVLGDTSGYQKISIIFRNDTLNTVENLSVTASSSLFSGSNQLSITPLTPTVVGYLNNDGFIDYANGSQSTLASTENGAIIHFEPFFFSVPTSISNDVTFSYTDSNNNNITTGDTQNELRLTRPDGGGQSQFTISLGTVQYSLQNITRVFSFNFK